MCAVQWVLGSQHCRLPSLDLPTRISGGVSCKPLSGCTMRVPLDFGGTVVRHRAMWAVSKCFSSSRQTGQAGRQAAVLHTGQGCWILLSPHFSPAHAPRGHHCKPPPHTVLVQVLKTQQGESRQCCDLLSIGSPAIKLPHFSSMDAASVPMSHAHRQSSQSN